MDFALALILGLAGAVLREPVALIALAASTIAGATLRAEWWFVAPVGTFIVVYAAEAIRAGGMGGNVSIVGLGAFLSALLALAAFPIGRTIRAALDRFRVS
jgi:hypothetical protein